MGAITIPVKVKICSPNDNTIANCKKAWEWLHTIFIPTDKLKYQPEYIVKKTNFFTWYNDKENTEEWDYFKELEELPHTGALRLLILDCVSTGYRTPWGLAGGCFGIGNNWYEPSIFVSCFQDSFAVHNKCGVLKLSKTLQHELHLTLESCAEKSASYIVSHSADEYTNNKAKAIPGAEYAEAHRPLWENTCPYGYPDNNYCVFDCWSWRECSILKELAMMFLKEIGIYIVSFSSEPEGAIVELIE